MLCSVGSSILGLCPLDASSAARSRAERGFHAFNKSQKKRKTTETVYVTNKARTFTEGFLVPSLRVVLLTFETNSSVRKVFFQCRQQLTQGLKLMMVCLPLNSPTLGNFLTLSFGFLSCKNRASICLSLRFLESYMKTNKIYSSVHDIVALIIAFQECVPYL